jgi:hypothetical protein
MWLAILSDQLPVVALVRPLPHQLADIGFASTVHPSFAASPPLVASSRRDHSQPAATACYFNRLLLIPFRRFGVGTAANRTTLTLISTTPRFLFSLPLFPARTSDNAFRQRTFPARSAQEKTPQLRLAPAI